MSQFYLLLLFRYPRIKSFLIYLVCLLEQVSDHFMRHVYEKSFQVGLALSTAANMLGMLQWGIRQSSETENHLTSIERLLEYAKLEPEPSLANDEKQAKVKFTRKNAKDKLNSILSDEDPAKASSKSKSMAFKKVEKGSKREGEVSFEKFSFNYYTDGPIVLKSMNLTIRPGEKVGIGKLENISFFIFQRSWSKIPTSKFPAIKSWQNWCRKK